MDAPLIYVYIILYYNSIFFISNVFIVNHKQYSDLHQKGKEIKQIYQVIRVSITRALQSSAST